MMRYLRWFLPGLGLKRWLLVAALGVFVIGLGISLWVRNNFYASVERWLYNYMDYSAEFSQWLPPITFVLMLLVGSLLVILGGARLVRVVLGTLTIPGGGVAETYYQRRYLLRGPRVVAVGGGTGIPALLRGLKLYTSNLTAVVTVADDGGSSGRLRSEFGILPPGDIRNCLVALADTEPLMERLFQYRFESGDGLQGHPFGNLFILAMTETTGNFYDAVRASSQVLAVRGQVLPSTLDHVVLKAQLTNGQVVTGESLLSQSGSPIRRVYLERSDHEPIAPLPDALESLRQAEVIVLGPGSLFTSIIPNLLVPGVSDAIRQSRALKVYVCNVMTEPGETDGYTVSQHVKALIDHAGYGIVDICLVNNQSITDQLKQKYAEQNAAPVVVDLKETQRLGVEVVQADLADMRGDYVRHHSDRLSRHIAELFLNRPNNAERTPWDFFMLRQRLQEAREREARE